MRNGRGRKAPCIGMVASGGGWMKKAPLHPAVEALCEGMRKIGRVDLHVLLAENHARESREKRNESSWTRVAPGPGPRIWGGNFLARSAGLKRELNIIRPHLVHGQGTEKEAAWAAVFSGFPSVITLHGLMGEVARLPCNRFVIQYRIAAFLEKVAVQKADGVIAVSPHAEKMLARMHPRVCRIPNAVRGEFYAISPPTPRPVSRVLFSGHLTPAKRPEWFLEAVHSLWEVGLKFEATLMGMGDPHHPYFQKIETQARRTVRGRRIRWLVNQPGVGAEIRRADILFHPSMLENMSIALAEAMAAGRCVVAADIPGNVSLLGREGGLLFSSGQQGAAVQALRAALSQPARRAEAGARARKMAQMFRPEIIAGQTVDFYGKILGKKIPR